MRRWFQALADLLRRAASEEPRDRGDPSSHEDPHVGQKAEDEPGFGRSTGAEARDRSRRPRPPEDGLTTRAGR